MANVPQTGYNPVPQTGPGLSATPEMHINAPIEAFGGAVAQATSHLGQVTDKVADEIGTRALAMQQLKNEADARTATVDYAMKAGQVYQDFASQSGANAGPEAFKQFQQNINDLRTQTRSTLTNPMAQSKFDSDAASDFIRLNNLAAGHSARELKSYDQISHKAAAEQAANVASLAPLDPAARQKAFDISDQAAESIYAGHPPEEIQQQKEIMRSNVAVGQITTLAQSDPAAATKMFHDDTKNGVLRGEVIGKVQATLDAKNNQLTSRSIAHGIFDGTSMAMGQGQVDLPRAAAAVRDVESSNNYTLLAGDPGHRQIGAYSILEPYFKDYLKTAGLSTDITPEQFIKDPQMQDKVFAAVYNDGIAKGHTANEIAQRWQQGHYPGEGKDIVDSNGVSGPMYVGKFNAALANHSTVQQKQEVGRTQARLVDAENPTLEDYTASRIETIHNQQEKEQQQTAAQTKVAIDTEIEKQVAGGKPVSVESLRSSPELSAMVDKADPIDIQRRIKAAQSADNNPTPARTDNFNRLNGMGFTDPHGLMTVDASKEDLTAQQRTEIGAMQKQILSKGVIEDPAMKLVVSDPSVRQIADSIQVGPLSKNKEEWNKFTGAISEEVKFMRAQGKAPTREDIVQIASTLAQKNVNAGLFSGENYNYQIPLHAIPQNVQTRAKTELKKVNGGRDPTEPEIEDYAAKLLFTLTTKKSNAKPL